MHLTCDLFGGFAFSAEDIATLRQLGEYRGKQDLFGHQRPEVFNGGAAGRGDILAYKLRGLRALTPGDDG